MSDQIKIEAKIEPSKPQVCTLILENPLSDKGAILFYNEEIAQQSPLAKAIFALGGVDRVRVNANEISIATKEPVDWREFAKKIAGEIRSFVVSGQALVPEEFVVSRQPDNVVMVRIQSLFDEKVNPAIASHGGHAELVDVKDGNVFVRMGGGCQGCGMAAMTLRQGIERAIREEVPEVDEVIDVTDHGAGENPYYAKE